MKISHKSKTVLFNSTTFPLNNRQNTTFFTFRFQISTNYKITTIHIHQYNH